MTVIKCQTKVCSKIIPDGEQKTIVSGDLEFTVCRKCHDMIVSFISNKGAMDQFMLRRNREHQGGRVCNRCRADDGPDE